MTKLDAQLHAMETMDKDGLQTLWTKLTGKAVPQVSMAMLRLATAWELQAKAKGGLSRSARQQIDRAGGRSGSGSGSGSPPSASPTLRPGMRLAREWQGIMHVVTVSDDGTLLWNGRAWGSLSQVARAITGTRWSGPAFFGLKNRKAPA